MCGWCASITRAVIGESIIRQLYDELFAAGWGGGTPSGPGGLRKVRAPGFKPGTDFKLRSAQHYPVWKD